MECAELEEKAMLAHQYREGITQLPQAQPAGAVASLEHPKFTRPFSATILPVMSCEDIPK
jgi:hypothetical protein